ncbi:ABC transporter permease subunit [Roseibium aggregatum]|uniref:ABC transporter permease subunit n=1 Tax=Roseibium aggregatum TaxID=187304 RepID=A0A926S5K3_9HYPH|nr:ABC transporter permease subunit [Roseibium aggregatum]MBD1546250.1 ABC transporter permease subunit [Roseibium aggregatum]
MNPIYLIARKETGELLLDIRGLLWLMAVTIVLSAFSLLLVGSTELSLLDNAQVVYDMTAIVTALGCLLALIVGVDTVAGERERGSLVPLLLTPAPRGTILMGKLSGVAIAWAVIYVLSLPYLWAVGSTGQNMGQGMLITALLGTPVVLMFGFLGISLGSRADSARTALLTGLVTLVLSASPVLLGPSLRQSAIGRMFDAVNPFSAAVNAYDAVIIDSQSIISQSTHFAIALAWLFACLWFARFSFGKITR